MRKTIFAIAAALVLSAHAARAETAITKALDACGKLDGAHYSDCLDKIPKCKAVLTRNASDYWHKGMVFEIDGGSDDPGQLCQHGGNCIPISAVKFKTACMIVKQNTKLGPYYHWEPGDGSLPNKAKHGASSAFKDALKYCANNPDDERISSLDEESFLSISECLKGNWPK